MRHTYYNRVSTIPLTLKHTHTHRSETHACNMYMNGVLSITNADISTYIYIIMHSLYLHFDTLYLRQNTTLDTHQTRARLTESTCARPRVVHPHTQIINPHPPIIITCIMEYEYTLLCCMFPLSEETTPRTSPISLYLKNNNNNRNTTLTYLHSHSDME